jgi:hypothetical protein
VAGFTRVVIGFLRSVFHLAEAASIGGKHKALRAPDAGLDPKTQLLQSGPDFQAEAAFTRVDQDGDGRAGGEILRYLSKRCFDGLNCVLPHDQADRVLPLWNAAGCGCGYADESAPPEPKIQFHTIAAGGDGAMKSGQARESDHGVDDLLTIGNGIGLNHLALLRRLFDLSCDAPCAGGWEGELAARIELDFTRQLDDCFGVMTVLEKRLFEGLRAVDEQAAIETVLFLGDPVAAPVLADKDDCRCRAARGRFDELHVRCPSVSEVRALPRPRTFRRFVLRVQMVRWLWSAGGRLD